MPQGAPRNLRQYNVFKVFQNPGRDPYLEDVCRPWGIHYSPRLANGLLGRLALAYAAFFGAEWDEGLAPGWPSASHCIPKASKRPRRRALMGISVSRRPERRDDGSWCQADRHTDARRAPASRSILV